MLTLLDHDLSMARHQLEALLAMAVFPTRKMDIYVACLIRPYFQLTYLQRLTMTVTRDGREASVAKITEKVIRSQTNAYANIVANGVAAGEFKAIDPMLFHILVIGNYEKLK